MAAAAACEISVRITTVMREEEAAPGRLASTWRNLRAACALIPQRKRPEKRKSGVKEKQTWCHPLSSRA